MGQHCGEDGRRVPAKGTNSVPGSQRWQSLEHGRVAGADMAQRELSTGQGTPTVSLSEGVSARGRVTCSCYGCSSGWAVINTRR